MATFLAKIRIYPGQEAQFETTARHMYSATLAEAGCLRYEYWRGAEERSYYCLESWRDYRSFIAHQLSEHHELPDWSAMLEHIEIEWLDPVDGASDLPQTRAQGLAPAAGPAAVAHAERIPMKIQPWWLSLRGG